MPLTEIDQGLLTETDPPSRRTSTLDEGSARLDAIGQVITGRSVSFSSPANDATLSGISTVTASASDNVGVAKVEFYQDNSLIGSAVSAPYSLALDTTRLPDGAYTLSAKAYDAAGNVGARGPVGVTVKNAVTVPSGSVSASPNPCSIPAGGVSCTAAVSWQAANAPQAGLFVREQGVLVSGAPGTYSPSYINAAGFNFDVRADQANANSTLLATVLVKGAGGGGSEQSGVAVGAIRWDAWYHGDNMGFIENLSPAKWHYRLPFFATGSPSAITMTNVIGNFAKEVSAGIIMLTAFRDSTIEKDARLLGVSVFLTKPVDAEVLLRTIVQLLAKPSNPKS